mmetsp:Transcript_11495/g.27595  ORF Transcript_11495/g.27595 Transcript_11495/m.27595 type:complete len:203 (+) Transcript_11495:318-926(+)
MAHCMAHWRSWGIAHRCLLLWLLRHQGKSMQRRLPAHLLRKAVLQPRMPQGIFDRHALHWISVHQLCDKVLGIIGQALGDLCLEELGDATLLQQQEVRVLHRGVGALEERYGGEQVEGVPPEAPGVHAAGKVLLFFVELGWAEVVRDQAVEGNGLLLPSGRIHDKSNGLPGVAHAHLPLPIFFDEKEHVLQRDVLHRQAPHV